MTVIGVDDTDSRERGMCTTYLGTVIADCLAEEAPVQRRLLIRLNPAVEHKTRGNAAVAIHTSAPAKLAYDVAAAAIEDHAALADPATDPGLVVAPERPDDIGEDVVAFASRAVREELPLDGALETIDDAGYRSAGWKLGRGRIGALAAIGAWRAFDTWTYELLAYRAEERWGTPREVDEASVFTAADRAYPAVWDTVDREEREAVCVPHTPGPVLFGIRGEASSAVRTVADAIESEPVDRHALFTTNQGTDAHLATGRIGTLVDGRAYRVTGTVAGPPVTERGGHVFVDLVDGGSTLQCVAFEPTKRFRSHVRALAPGDRITACGEVARGTLKLEKFAVRERIETTLETPACPDCGRRMKSAGTDQGYRCRPCGTAAPAKERRPLDRGLERGWYEVPPCARRHIAKPLVRGGYDAAVHPER